MKNQDLDKSVNDYVSSLNVVIKKRKLWDEVTKPLLLKHLSEIKNKYSLGWQVQELNWVLSNKSVNLSFKNFPLSLANEEDGVLNYEFVKGAALVFSQKYNGDIFVFILYPTLTEFTNESDLKELGTYNPNDIDENFIKEKVIDFLEEMTHWEGINIKRKVGF